MANDMLLFRSGLGKQWLLGWRWSVQIKGESWNLCMILVIHFSFLETKVFNNWILCPRQARCECWNKDMCYPCFIYHWSLQCADEIGTTHWGKGPEWNVPHSTICVQFSYCTTLTTARWISSIESKNKVVIFRNVLNVTNTILQLIACGRQKWAIPDRHRKLSFHKLKPVISPLYASTL
jgi:hypothetical protein